MKRIVLFLAGFAVCLIVLFFFTVLAQKPPNESTGYDSYDCMDASARIGDVAGKAGSYYFWANLE